MSNKKNGNDFEQEFCKMLAADGFWAHNMANRKNGQPADVIAVRNGQAYLIDCKYCKRDVFEFSRVEENQRLAMERWQECGNGIGLFAIKTSMGIYMLTLNDIYNLSVNSKSIDADLLQAYFYNYEKWERNCV